MNKFFLILGGTILVAVTLGGLAFGIWCNGQSPAIVADNAVMTPVTTGSPNVIITFLGCLLASSVLVFFGLVGLGIYLLPTIIAYRKHKRNWGAICLLNVLTAPSGIGWLASLIWACVQDPKAEATV
jgi:hypothetical protein